MTLLEKIDFSSFSLISDTKNLVMIGWGAFERFSSLQKINPHQPAFYLQDFFLSYASAWLQYEKWQIFSIEQLQSILKCSTPKKLNWKIEGEASFKKAFKELKIQFEQNKLKKAVPYLFSYANAAMSQQRFTYCLSHAFTIKKKYPDHFSGYLYGHCYQQQGFLGLTPELLFSYEKEPQPKVITMALAGTKKKEEEATLLSDAKELKEHQLVITGIKKSLSSLGKVQVGETKVLSLPTLSHLLTFIQMTPTKAFDFNNYVKKLHPTPALGAFPKKAGAEWLLGYQKKVDRKSYGAPFGYYHPPSQKVTCIVAIRQIQWGNRKIRIGAGCGVIAQSSLEKEWQEILLKIKAIKNIFPL